jgi:hypothetical protein
MTNGGSALGQWKWNAEEKAVARRAFNLAFDRELAAVIQRISTI